MVFQFFPRSQGLDDKMKKVLECFESVNAQIGSQTNDLKSNDVLRLLREPLENLNYTVEKGRKKGNIKVPVLFGKDNKVDRVFYADAVSDDGSVVLEIEAGRATENNAFLKDIFQACMMHSVDYLVLAVRERYRTHNDFDVIYSFLETLYISNRLKLPLKGILLIGY